MSEHQPKQIELAKTSEQIRSPEQVLRDFLTQPFDPAKPWMRGLQERIMSRFSLAAKGTLSGKGYIALQTGLPGGASQDPERLALYDAMLAYEVEHRTDWQEKGAPANILALALDARRIAHLPLTRRVLTEVSLQAIVDDVLPKIRTRSERAYDELADLLCCIEASQDVAKENLRERVLDEMVAKFLASRGKSPIMRLQCRFFYRQDVAPAFIQALLTRGHRKILESIYEAAISSHTGPPIEPIANALSLPPRKKEKNKEAEAIKKIEDLMSAVVIKDSHFDDLSFFQASTGGANYPHVLTDPIHWEVFESVAYPRINLNDLKYILFHQHLKDIPEGEGKRSINAKIQTWYERTREEVFLTGVTRHREALAKKFKNGMEKCLSHEFGYAVIPDECLDTLVNLLAFLKQSAQNDKTELERLELYDWLQDRIKAIEEFIERERTRIMAERDQHAEAEHARLGAKQAQAEVRRIEVEKRKITEKQEERDQRIMEYLGDLVGMQAKYLRDLYASCLGLDLPELESFGLHTDTGELGSVQIGSTMGMRMRQDMRMQHKLSPEEGIFVEMGKDLETAKRRFTMVDWVGPHEVAHLVDWDDRERSAQALEETYERFGQFESQIPDDEAFHESLRHQVQECFIDGVGCAMATAFGVSDPRRESSKERLVACIRSFLVTMQEVRFVIDAETEEEKLSPFIGVLLRQIAVAEALGDMLEEEHPLRYALQKQRSEHDAALQGLWAEVATANPLFEALSFSEMGPFQNICKEAFLAGVRNELVEKAG